MSNWLIFVKQDRPENKKTDTYTISNKVNGIQVGQIYWYGGFRKYIFAANDKIIFDSNCLKEISDFLDALMQERKLEKISYT